MSCAKPIIRMGPQIKLKSGDYKNGNLSLSPSISVSKEIQCTSMGLEYIALVDAASKLGTYQLNRNAPPLLIPSKNFATEKPLHSSEVDVENVREEAELLWKFATSAPCKEDMKEEEPNSSHAPISPSLSFEAKRHFQSKPRSSFIRTSDEEIELQVPFSKTSNDQCPQGQPYSLTFPSLSLADVLQPNLSLSTQASTSTPEKLFSRSITINQNSKAKLSSETIANNIMQSFLKAIDWRSKVWTKSLSHHLHSEYEKKTGYRKGEEPKEVKNHQARNGEHRQVNYDCDANNVNPAKNASPSIAIINQCITRSKEAKVLRAIVHAASSVVVHDVRTTFQVLEQQLDRTSSPQDYDIQTSRISAGRVNYGRPPPKKRRTNRCHERRYKLSHAINLETRCTVSTKCVNSPKGLTHKTIVLQAPGVIDGTFYRSSDGDVKLVDVVVELDTQALALSMEKNSRLVLRTAAQNYILNPPKPDLHVSLTKPHSQEIITDDSFETTESEPESIEEESHGVHYDDTDAPTTPYSASQYVTYPEATMVTPMEDISRSSSVSEDMPPPAPRLPDVDRVSLDKSLGLPLRRVSPSYISSPRNDGPSNQSPDPFASPIPTKPATNLTLTGGATEQSFDAIAQYLAPPFLISPRTPSDDSHSKQNFLSPRVAPSLPALVEVACAAHAHCN